MKSRADRLRGEIAAIREQGPFHARRYPAALQRAVVAYVHEQRGLGHRPRRVARELGLTQQTLAHWLRVASPAIRPVTVAPRAPRLERSRASDAGGPVLVLPGGHRVEGLAFEELVTLVRALS